MYRLRIKDKDYEIKFGYKPTLKARIISKMVKANADLEGTKENSEEKLLKMEDMLSFIPEIILVGLQKNHKDEFGYDCDTEEGKEAALDKVFDLMDDYFDGDDANVLTLYNDLQNEMLKESFFKSMFQKEEAEQKENNQKSKKTTKS